MVDLPGKVNSLAHPLINVWKEDGGVVIFEVTSTGHFNDDTIVKIARQSALGTASTAVSRLARWPRDQPRSQVQGSDQCTSILQVAA